MNAKVAEIAIKLTLHLFWRHVEVHDTLQNDCVTALTK